MNKWKIAFFLLAGAVLLLIGLITFLLLSPAEDVVKPSPQQVEGNVVVMETTVEEFESIARQYIGSSLNDSPLPVEFDMNDRIQLFSTFTIFNVEVPITMDFDPIVEEDGNITLKQTEVNVGKLNIPPTTVLKLLNDSVDFPDFITVDANKAQIYVDLSRINIANGSRVRAKEIDFANDKILLEIIIAQK